MTTPEQQIDRLHEAMTILNRDNATSEDVTKLFKLALEAIKKVKEQLNEQMALNKGELSDKTKNVINDLRALDVKVNSLSKEIPQTKEKINSDIDKVVIQIFKEVKRIESLIPTIDFSPLEQRITKVENIKVPEVTRVEIRDKLETFEGDERLDVRAVNSAPKMTVSLSAPKEPMIGDLWGVPDR